MKNNHEETAKNPQPGKDASEIVVSMMVGGVAAQLARVEPDESMHASRTSHIVSAIFLCRHRPRDRAASERLGAVNDIAQGVTVVRVAGNA